MGICLEKQVFGDQVWWCAVAVAVEVNAQVFVDQHVHGIAVIGKQCRQGPQRLRLETLCGPLACFTMLTLNGDFGEPLTCLAVDIVQA